MCPGAPHSMVAGFNKQAPQEDHGGMVYDLTSKSTEHHFCHSQTLRFKGKEHSPKLWMGQYHSEEEHVGWETLLLPSWKMQSAIIGKNKEQSIGV